MQKYVNLTTLEDNSLGNLYHTMKIRSRFNFNKASILLVAMVFFIACKRDMEKPQWDTDVLAPFAYTEMSIKNLVKNGGFQTNPDNSMDLFIRDTLYTLRMDSLVSVTAPSFNINQSLQTIIFDTPPIVTKITLGMIAHQLVAQGGSNKTLGNLILGAHGFPFPVTINPVQDITGGPIEINIADVLESAEINTGFLDISIVNQLPLDITNASFSISNTSPPSAIVAQPTLSNIAKGTSAVYTEDISGKHVDGRLSAFILDLDLSGGSVRVDTNAYVSISLKVREVTVTAATAVFPEQNVIDDQAVNYLLDMGSVRLKEMKMASGTVKIQVSSTIPDTIFFTYEIPGATKNGVPFTTSTKVPPTGGSTAVFTYDMTDYVMSLRGKPGDDEYNGLYNTLKGRIKYTGKKVSLSLSDYITVQIVLENAVPTYVKGYMGDTIIDLNDTAPLTVFKNITGGTIQFEEADPSVVIENGFGISGSAKIDAIVAHKGAAAVTLSSSLLGNAVAIGKGFDGNPPTTTSTKISLGGVGSNATALINLMPDRIDYAGQLQVNPSKVVDYSQFAYAKYPCTALMEFRLPLSLIANQLQLSDTIPLSSSGQVNAALKKGKLNLITDNGFPLDASVKAYFLDASGVAIDSLASNQLIKRGPKGADGKVIKSERTIITYTLSAGTINNIQRATQVCFKVKFNSESGNYTKIYSDYRIKFKLTGDVQFTVNAEQ